MRPGQLTPENEKRKQFEGKGVGASMRPGQLTPENEQQRRLHFDYVDSLQ